MNLPYKWPLLADGQDPNALEARLAFHLHRLGLTGEPLRQAINGKARISTALSQARLEISLSAITELAAILNVAADDLTRELSDEETREWTFYRTSAQNRHHVWKEASARWTSHGLSKQDVSNITGVPRPNITKTLTGEAQDILDWRQAKALLSAIKSDAPPEDLLPDTER